MTRGAPALAAVLVQNMSEPLPRSDPTAMATASLRWGEHCVAHARRRNRWTTTPYSSEVIELRHAPGFDQLFGALHGWDSR